MENHEAQFMLLAGFIIAIGLVVVTIMLNSIIFEGNKAIVAGAESSRIEIVNLMQMSRDEVRSAYRNATATGGNAVDNFDRQMGKFGYYLPVIYALHVEGINVSWENWSNKGYAYFTEDGTASGRSNWVVIEGVKVISAFELRNVSGSNFEVNISNQTTGQFLWSMRLSGADNIIVKNASGNICACAVDFSYIDLKNNLTYKLIENVGNNATKITFNNGSDAVGRFVIAGNATYGRDLIRARDYVLNATVTFSNSRAHANITIPVTVPW